MKSKKLIALLVCMLLVLTIIGACTQKTPDTTEIEPESTPEATTRVITDLSGKEVEIPAVQDIQKVIVVAPPYLSYFLSVVQQPEMVIGCHNRALGMANPELLKIFMPNSDSVNTKFLDGFKSNTEEVLLMDPDIILIYGEFQREGLEQIDIPVVNLQEMGNSNVESSYKAITLLLGEIFGIDVEQKVGEWDKAQEIADAVLSKHEDETKQKGLVVFANTGSEISVRGIGSFGDDWLNITGLENVVAMEGDNLTVSMEDIYNWNPDIIYTMGEVGAEKMLANSIEGQDWSHVAAFNSGRIYDFPKSLTQWHADSPDAPLTLQWMISKNFPDDLPEDVFLTTMKQYYKTNYNIDLTDELLHSILNPKKG